jgi:hypothetical protein
VVNSANGSTITSRQLAGFCKEAREIISEYEKHGWIFRLSSKGHAIGRSPSGSRTASVSRKLPLRTLKNSQAQLERDLREDIIEVAAGALSPRGMDELVNGVPVDELSDPVDQVVARGLGKKLRNLDTETSRRTGPGQTLPQGNGYPKATASSPARPTKEKPPVKSASKKGPSLDPSQSPAAQAPAASSLADSPLPESAAQPSAAPIANEEKRPHSRTALAVGSVIDGQWTIREFECIRCGGRFSNARKAGQHARRCTATPNSTGTPAGDTAGGHVQSQAPAQRGEGGSQDSPVIDLAAVEQTLSQVRALVAPDLVARNAELEAENQELRRRIERISDDLSAVRGLLAGIGGSDSDI